MTDHRLVPRQYLIPFLLVTALFFLWAIPHNLNDVLIRQFMKSFELTRLKAGLIQSAFYLGYFALAIARGAYHAGAMPSTRSRIRPGAARSASRSARRRTFSASSAWLSMDRRRLIVEVLDDGSRVRRLPCRVGDRRNVVEAILLHRA